MKINIITISLSILFLISCGGGTYNGNVPTCDNLDSQNGEQIAKYYLKGSWVDEYDDDIWGKTRFVYDGVKQLHMWKREPKSGIWRDEGLFSLIEIKSYQHTTTYGCTEFVFNFYNGSTRIPIIIESTRGACIERVRGREQFVHFKS